MVPDKHGFLYPHIDSQVCIGCKKCLGVCTYQSSSELNKTMSAYAAVNKSDKDLKSSSSGGVFLVFAKYFINNGGTVYGAALLKEDQLKVKHIRVSDINDLYKIQGSKYVQSNASIVYKDVKQDLLDNKKVLFTGTPCQVNGLKGFLKKQYENLFTIDIICHGVPSEKMFQDYISYKEKLYNISIFDYKFRCKNKGQGMSSNFKYSKKNIDYEQTVNGKTESYVFLFLKSLLYRKNCYSCKYAKKERCSDITIGDYWGFHVEHPDQDIKTFSNSKGISCLLVNTEKGNIGLNAVKEDFYLIQSSFEKVSNHNDQLIKPSKYDIRRKEILNRYAENGYDAVEKYFKNKFAKDILIERVKYFFPKSLKRKIAYYLSSIKKDK